LNSRRPEPEGGDYSIHIATTLRAVEDLGPVWKTWTNSLETDIEYYLHNLTSDSTILHPYVITICQGEIARAMLIGLVRRLKTSAAVSFIRIPGPTAKVLEIMKGGRLGQQSSAIDQLIARQLAKAIARDKINLLRFHRLPLRSELLSQLRQLPSLAVKQPVADASHDSILFLTSRKGKPAPVFSGKLMREVRRKTRILRRAFPNKARFKCFSEPFELDAGIRDSITVVMASWQHPLGYGLVDSCQLRESFRFFAKQGWLRIYVLYIDERPRAFLIGQLYNDTFYCQYAGYDLGFARFSVGSLLTAWALENLASTGVQQVDLGEGNREYNQRLGCEWCEAVRLDVCSPTLRGRWLSMFFTTTKIAQITGHGLLSRLGMNRIGKIWRDFLVARVTSTNVHARRKVGSVLGGLGGSGELGDLTAIYNPTTKEHDKHGDF